MSEDQGEDCYEKTGTFDDFISFMKNMDSSKDEDKPAESFEVLNVFLFAGKAGASEDFLVFSEHGEDEGEVINHGLKTVLDFRWKMDIFDKMLETLEEEVDPTVDLK